MSIPCRRHDRLLRLRTDEIIWINKAKLPNGQRMLVWYEKTVEERGGCGKYLLFLGGERTSARIAYLIGWLNEAAVKYGDKQVDGVPKYSKEVAHYWQIAHYGGSLQLGGSKEEETMSASLGIVLGDGADKETYDDVIFYDDDW